MRCKWKNCTINDLGKVVGGASPSTKSTHLLPKYSVLFSSRAPIGYVAIAGQEMCTNQGFKSIIPNAGTDYMFLYYLLKYKK